MSGDLHAAIDRLAEFNDDPAAGGITREVYTPTYAAALEWVAERMRGAGLQTRVDAFGNLWGALGGRGAGRRRAWSPARTSTRRSTPAATTAWSACWARSRPCARCATRASSRAAPSRWSPSPGRSRASARAASAAARSSARSARDDLDALRDRDGVSLAEALRGAGFDPARIADARLDPATVHAFVELHIEQGVVLETHGEAIGVVTAIAAPHDLRLILRGAATHAGATPMALRRDALAGAAEVMTALERLARESPSGTTVGTVGVLRARPGAINVVPGEAELDVDVRDSDLAAREAVVDGLLAAAHEICERRDLELEVQPIVQDTPVVCADEVVAAAEAACEELALTFRRMTSGAYHDAMIMAAEVPVGMVFVPSAGGVSHHPDEYTAPEQLDAGVRVLAGVLARLSQNPSR